jgi:hypothetical protein
MGDPFLDPGGQPASPEDLILPRARELAALLASGVLAFARLVDCRCSPTSAPGGEAIIFDVSVERPQLTTYPIQQIERIAAVFTDRTALLPEVLALRADFPLVPHLNLRKAEFPRSLCLDARPWQEVSRRWTAALFVERIRWWLAQTARGTLHGDDQPLEPLVEDLAVPLFLPADLLSAPLQKHEILRVKVVGRSETLALLAKRAPVGANSGPDPEYVAIALRCEPQPHGVIRHHPDTLEELHALTSAAGLDLRKALKDRFWEWRHRERIRSCRLIILLSLPKQRRPGGLVEETDHLAVACFDTITEVALKLGERRIPKSENMNRRRREKRAPKLPRPGDPIKVYLLRPVYGLTPARAARLCGDQPRESARRVAVGSGALGSQVLMSLSRAGYTGWDVIDDDRLFPHNLQRHALDGVDVGFLKAVSMETRMNSRFDGSQVAAAIPANLLHPGDDCVRIERSLSEADTILDFSASVAVARHLAWRDAAHGRRVSLFLNPAGTDLVLLAEDEPRTITLDGLEMQYYRAILREPRLANHLASPEGRIRYSASCRDVSSRVPTHLVALHAAIGAGALPSALSRPEALIKVWQADPVTLGVTPIVVVPATLRRGRIGEWTLIVDDELLQRLGALRAGKLPNETGGILLGTYDMDRRAVYVIETIPSPPDSAEWPALYIRGCEGLTEEVADARLRTGGQVEYVGEWHSHPDGCATLPSKDDLQVFGWLAEHMAVEGLPTLMAIVGEGAASSWYLGEMRPPMGWGVRLDR